MKLITRDSDYAIRALSCIAASGIKKFSVRSLSERLGIPKAFLRKILQHLNKEGFLSSFKGKGGGFSLKIPVEEVSILDIMQIFQGPFALMEHTFKKYHCPNADICKLKRKIDTLESSVKSELANIKIKDLLTRT